MEVALHLVQSNTFLQKKIFRYHWIKGLQHQKNNNWWIWHKWAYVCNKNVGPNILVKIKIYVLTRAEWLFSRSLVGSTDNAYSCGFYFRISSILIERPCLLQNHSLSFLQGLRSLKSWLQWKVWTKVLIEN